MSFSQLLRRLVILQPGEAPVLLASLRRCCACSRATHLAAGADALGITSGLENIPYLFWGVFAVMLLLQRCTAGSPRGFRARCFCRGCTVSSPPTCSSSGCVRLQADHILDRARLLRVGSVFNLFVVAAFGA